MHCLKLYTPSLSPRLPPLLPSPPSSAVPLLIRFWVRTYTLWIPSRMAVSLGVFFKIRLCVPLVCLVLSLDPSVARLTCQTEWEIMWNRESRTHFPAWASPPSSSFSSSSPSLPPRRRRKRPSNIVDGISQLTLSIWLAIAWSTSRWTVSWILLYTVLRKREGGVEKRAGSANYQNVNCDR